MQEKKKKKLQNSKNQLNQYAKYSGIAFQMFAVIFIGVFGGIKLDDYISFNFPLFTILFTLFSVILAIYIAIKDFIKK